MIHVLPEVPAMLDQTVIGYVSEERWQQIKSEQMDEAKEALIGKKREHLAIKEALVQFDDETKAPYVEVMVSDQQFERRDLELGVSDGIYVDVKSGLAEEDAIKVWNALASEESGA